jgi:hypothetical protein
MDVVICQEHVLCEAGRCGDANGRVVCFYLDSKTSSLIESQPYACYTIAGNLGAATRSNKATWVWSIIQRSVACCQEDGGHRLRCNQDDELRPARKIPRAKASGDESGIVNVVGSDLVLVDICP